MIKEYDTYDKNEEIINKLIGKKIAHPSVMKGKFPKNVEASEYILGGALFLDNEDATEICYIRISDGVRSYGKLNASNIDKAVRFLLRSTTNTEESALKLPIIDINYILDSYKKVDKEEDSATKEIRRLKEIERKYNQLLKELNK